MRFFVGDGRFVTALKIVLAKHARGKFKALVRPAQAFYFGADECAADACMPENDEAGDWGLVTGAFYAYILNRAPDQDLER